MALDITVSGEVEATTTAMVTTNNIRVAGVYFDFINSASFASIEYGNGVGDDFVPMKQETWKLSGDYYASKNKELAPVLLGKIDEVTLSIQGDTAVKDALIYIGELKVIAGDVAGMIYGAL